MLSRISSHPRQSTSLIARRGACTSPAWKYGGEGLWRRPADLGPGIRIAPFEHSAVVAYRVEDDAVEIVNVFYGGRDYEAALLDDEE